MSKYRIGIASLLVILGLGGSAEAEKLSKEASQFVYKVSTVLVRLPPSVCEQEMTQSSKSYAIRVQNDLIRERAPALADYKAAVPESEREHPKVKAAIEKADKFLNCLAFIDENLKSLDARVERNIGFRNAAGSAQGTIEKLHGFVDHPDTPMWSSEASEVAKWKSDLEMVHGLCTGQFKGIRHSGAFANDPNHNLELWCKTAAIRDRIIKQVATNLVTKQVESAVEKFENEIKNFEQHNGHIYLSGNMYLEAFYEPAKFRSEIEKRVSPVLAIAGIEMGAALDPFDKVHAALWEKIRKAGPTWKRPKQEGAEASAVRAAKRRFKANKVMTAYMTRGDWKLHKNSRGVVTDRTKVGNVIYKVKSDSALAGPLCRSQTFTYSESKVGSRFKKSNEISELGFVRFESCK